MHATYCPCLQVLTLTAGEGVSCKARPGGLVQAALRKIFQIVTTKNFYFPTMIRYIIRKYSQINNIFSKKNSKPQ